MSETEFLAQVEVVLGRIENRVEALADELDTDMEASRSGNVLTVELADHSKIIINSQAAMQEIWVAAKTGGFHYRHDGATWRNTRDHSELFATLDQLFGAAN
jgi:CyaY protein